MIVLIGAAPRSLAAVPLCAILGVTKMTAGAQASDVHIPAASRPQRQSLTE